METIVQECQRAKDCGRTPEEVLHLLARRGLTITEAIKVFMKVYQIPLGEAKETVATSPFCEIVKASKPLHDRLAEDVRDVAVSQKRLHEPRESLEDVEKRLAKPRKTKTK